MAGICEGGSALGRGGYDGGRDRVGDGASGGAVGGLCGGIGEEGGRREGRRRAKWEVVVLGKCVGGGGVVWRVSFA